MARQRTVYPTDEIPHLWAHQTQEHARNALGNLYFNGQTIYSYGSHFPIARIVRREGQGAIVLWNWGTYSKTTSRQQHRVRSAIPRGMRIIAVPDPCPYGEAHSDNLRRMADNARSLLAQAHRARGRKGELMAAAESLAADARALAEFFGLPAPELPQLDAYGAELAAQAEARAREEERQEREAREAARRIELAADMAAWLRGAAGVDAWAFPDTLLRVNPANPEEVQTSRGVVFPVEHARRLWPILARLYATGATYRRNGHSIHLGHYTLDEVDAKGTVHAGCHRIKREEVERFARVLGLRTEEAQHAA